MRGRGLWLAVEFVKDQATREKDFAFAARVARRCLEKGLYPIHDSISWFVRIQPPLNIEPELFEQGMDILEESRPRDRSRSMNEAPLDRRALERVLLPLGSGRLLPQEAYTSQAVLDWEQRQLFAGSWVCVGRSDDVARPGDQKGVRVGRDSLLLVRGADAVLRAFWNVCRHRAHELLQSGECTNDRLLRCPYHGWSYELDGSLHPSVKASHGPGFDPGAEGLQPARAQEWHGFAFVNPSGGRSRVRRVDRRSGGPGRALPDRAAARGGHHIPTRSRPTGSWRWRTTTSATTARASTPSCAG